MNPTLTKKLLITLMVPMIAGCQAMSHPGFPRQSYNEKQTIKQLEAQFPATLIDTYYAQTNEADKEMVRNKIIDGRIALINLNYNQFVARFSVTRQSIDAGAEITELGLNLATTAAGGAAAKTTLAAISAGVTGTKLAIDKNFFFEKTIPVLVASMNAQRKEALAPILRGTGQSTQQYPLTQALSDIDAYYFAGTFVGALQTIQADAGVKEKNADDVLKNIRMAEILTGAQMEDSTVLLKIWGQLNDQIKTGKKIADDEQKSKLRKSLQTVLGSTRDLSDATDSVLVTQLHRFIQMQPERAGELLQVLKENQYSLP